MRIEGQSAPPSPSGPTGPSGASASSGARQAPVDALEVSQAARRVAEVQRRVAALPDVRMEKVVALQTQLDAGAYHPDGGAVAEGLIKDHLTPPSSA